MMVEAIIARLIRKLNPTKKLSPPKSKATLVFIFNDKSEIVLERTTYGSLR